MQNLQTMRTQCERIGEDAKKLATAKEAFDAELLHCRTNFPDMLSLALRVLDLSGKELADKLNITQNYFSSLHTGRLAHNASPELICRVAELLQKG